MNRSQKTLAGLGAGALLSTIAAFIADAQNAPPKPKIIFVAKPDQTAQYRAAIEKTALMCDDPKAQKMAAARDLQILNLTWEDTGRYKGSSVGPNISDMTIQVAAHDAKTGKLDVTCMPVIRHPNFSDKTADLDPRDFTLLIGNQAKRPLRRVSLADFLEEPTAFMTRPWSWKGPKKTLWAPRDTKVLVSAQACFLPIPKSGKATFNPVIFNYQSTKGDPAVLTILATREGTSMTIIDNARDAFATGAVWGQRLFHNQNGQRASLTGTRQSEFLAKNPNATAGHQAAGERGLNMVLLVQVPLKQKTPMRFKSESADYAAAPMMAPPAASERRSDVENAVIGHGDLEGKYTETDFLPIERDPKFPVRVTVQFYKATSNGVVSDTDLKEIKAQIDRVYAKSDYVGSLVTQGETGRVTEYEGVKVQPADWWQQFWQRHQHETGDTRAVAMAKLGRLLGKNYRARPVSELYLHDLMRKG